MALNSDSFVPVDVLPRFLGECWAVYNAAHLPGVNINGGDTSYNVTVTNGSFVVSQTEISETPGIIPISLIQIVGGLLIPKLVIQFAGFAIFAAIFGEKPGNHHCHSN